MHLSGRGCMYIVATTSRSVRLLAKRPGHITACRLPWETDKDAGGKRNFNHARGEPDCFNKDIVSMDCGHHPRLVVLLFALARFVGFRIVGYVVSLCIN